MARLFNVPVCSDLDDRIVKTLPQSFLIAAFLLAIGIGVDLPWLDTHSTLIIAIRSTIVAGALLLAWSARHCRTREQAELLAAIGILLATVGFALLGWIEETYLTGYIAALYQLLAFAAIFLSLRLPVLVALAILVGIIWFGLFPVAVSMRLGDRLYISHLVGYLSFVLMALEGCRRFYRLLDDERRLRSDLVERTHRLRKLATHDELTGIHNYRHFHETLPKMMQEACERSESLCLCLLDLDDFKTMNDQSGHVYGNAILQQVGKCLLACIRRHDAVFRIGGDEFAMLLPSAGIDEAHRVAERISAALAAGGSIVKDDIRHDLSPIPCSIGIARMSSQWKTPDAFFQAADAALYRAKERGGDHIALAHTEPTAETSVAHT